MTPNRGAMTTPEGNLTQALAQLTPETAQELSPEIRAREAALIDAVITTMRLAGVRKSRAAVRDAVDEPFQAFGVREALSALSTLNFKASFGHMPRKNWHRAFFPMIAMRKDGMAFVVLDQDSDGVITLADPKSAKEKQTISSVTFEDQFSNYVLLAKALSDDERAAAGEHWFFGAFRKSKWLYVQVAIAAVVSNFLALTTAIFTMTTYDRIIPNSAIESLIALSIGVGIALFFDFIIKSLRGRFIDIASKRADITISRLLFDRILTLNPYEQRQKTGALAGVVREFETLREFFNSSTLVVLVDLPFIFFFIYVISLVAGPLAIVPLIAVPVVIFTGLAMQPMLAKISKGTMDGGMNKQAVLVETLSGLETVIATGSGRLMKKRYEDALHAQTDAGNRGRALSQFLINLSASAAQYVQVGLIFYGVFLIRDGEITQGALIAAVILSGRTMGPLSQLANALSRMNGAISAYKSLSKLIGGKSKELTRLTPISRPTFEGTIEFKNVSFKYAGAAEPVLKNLSFKIPAGQKVALVGKMGCGKSTLSRLIAGIYEPTEGAVLVDGVDIRQIEASDLKRNVGVMLQDSWLFSGTVRENIQMGHHEYDDAQLLRIAKIAGVDDFVGAHPKGYDLEIQEKGQGLSGGQRQTINLARALLHDPVVLLLDEPTSSMDQASETRIVTALGEACQGKTMLIVTHRNPIMALVDRVLVLDNGSVAADTTPEKLGLKK